MENNTVEDFLRKVEIFQDLADEDLNLLSEFVTKVEIGSGEVLFKEGDKGDSAYIIRDGAIEIKKMSDGEEVLLAVVGPGEVIGEMALLDEAPRMASAKAKKNTTLLSISSSQLDQLMNSSARATRALLFTVTSRWRETEALLLQNEKMAKLGTLTAGMAHELNNPAAAIQRGSDQIQEAFGGYLAIQKEFFPYGAGEELTAVLKSLEQKVTDSVTNPTKIDSLARSDIEYELESWLEGRGMQNAWDLAPALTSIGLDKAGLVDIAEDIPDEYVSGAIRWMSAAFNLHELIKETGQAAEHISKVVLALKTYAYQESASPQEFDLQQSIESALQRTESLMDGRIEIQKDYGADVPSLVGYPSELEQVWINLITNSVDAIDGSGKITIRTRRREGFIEIEFIDNGIGIPPNILGKVFDPFFTTKPPGKGAGLGLTISYNIISQKHHGEIQISSTPGKTKVTVSLPIVSGVDNTAPPSLSRMQHADDDTMREILTSAHDIAVVGASKRTDRAGNYVPKFLLERGYHIIPVNPGEQEIFGQKCYPDVASIPGNVDVVEVFLRGDEVPRIVDQAISKGAKAIWMQEGVINPLAAQKGREAGLMVVSDACMRKQYMRLIGDV